MLHFPAGAVISSSPNSERVARTRVYHDLLIISCHFTLLVSLIVSSLHMPCFSAELLSDRYSPAGADAISFLQKESIGY